MKSYLIRLCPTTGGGIVIGIISAASFRDAQDELVKTLKEKYEIVKIAKDTSDYNLITLRGGAEIEIALLPELEEMLNLIPLFQKK